MCAPPPSQISPLGFNASSFGYTPPAPRRVIAVARGVNGAVPPTTIRIVCPPAPVPPTAPSGADARPPLLPKDHTFSCPALQNFVDNAFAVPLTEAEVRVREPASYKRPWDLVGFEYALPLVELRSACAASTDACAGGDDSDCNAPAAKRRSKGSPAADPEDADSGPEGGQPAGLPPPRSSHSDSDSDTSSSDTDSDHTEDLEAAEVLGEFDTLDVRPPAVVLPGVPPSQPRLVVRLCGCVTVGG